MFFEFFQVLASLLQVGASAALYLGNQADRSIYGLLFDCLSFATLESLLATAVFLLGLLEMSQKGYNLRYPVFGTTEYMAVPLSRTVFVLNFVNLGICHAIVVRQVLLKYRHTRNEEQNVSYLAMAVISMGFITIISFLTWTLDAVTKLGATMMVTGKYGLLWIDLVELLCLMRVFCGAIRLLPQVSLNFSTLQPFGLPKTTILLQLLASAMVSISVFVFKPLQAGISYMDMYLVSLNYQVSILQTLLQIACCLVLLYQNNAYSRKKIVALKHKKLTNSLALLGVGQLDNNDIGLHDM